MTEEKFIVTAIPHQHINKVELTDWDKAQRLIQILLDSDYAVVVRKCENTYIVEYEFNEPEWGCPIPLWVEPDFIAALDEE